MTRSPSTTSRAGSIMLEPALPGSLSTVTTSSSATFSCLPPQRTIAYTRGLSLFPCAFLACPGAPVSPRRARLNSLELAHGVPRSGLLPTAKATRPQRVHEPGSFGLYPRAPVRAGAQAAPLRLVAAGGRVGVVQRRWGRG